MSCFLCQQGTQKRPHRLAVLSLKHKTFGCLLFPSDSSRKEQRRSERKGEEGRGSQAQRARENYVQKASFLGGAGPQLTCTGSFTGGQLPHSSQAHQDPRRAKPSTAKLGRDLGTKGSPLGTLSTKITQMALPWPHSSWVQKDPQNCGCPFRLSRFIPTFPTFVHQKEKGAPTHPFASLPAILGHKLPAAPAGATAGVWRCQGLAIHTQGNEACTLAEKVVSF